MENMAYTHENTRHTNNIIVHKVGMKTVGMSQVALAQALKWS